MIAPHIPAAAAYAWLAIDIETANARPEAAEQWMRKRWDPNPTWKAETIGNRFLDALGKKKERLALLDQAPILCVGLRSDTELRCLHSMYAHPPKMVGGGLVEGFATMREMLVALRNVLEVRVGSGTVLCGHNVLGFDFKKLRWAYLRERVRIPGVLIEPSQPVYDTMREYGKRFSLGEKGDFFIGLDDMLTEWGIDSHKGLIDGAMVPELFQQGAFDAIAGYVMLDVKAEADVFCRMTGRVLDESPPPPSPAGGAPADQPSAGAVMPPASGTPPPPPSASANSAAAAPPATLPVQTNTGATPPVTASQPTSPAAAAAGGFTF